MTDDKADFDIIGYSERGIVGALMHEITAQPPQKAASLFTGLLKYYTPMAGGNEKPRIESPVGCRVFLEPSFSQFGDPDAVVMIESAGGGRHCIFVEAKISNQRRHWSLSEQYERFVKNSSEHKKQDSSNLFTQLYHKMRLVGADIKDRRVYGEYEKALQAGIVFPESSTKKRRKIGTNKVVLRTLKTMHPWILNTENVWYLALIPAAPELCKPDFSKCPGGDQGGKYAHTGWDTGHLGYITWPDVREFCRLTSELKRVVKTFDHNEELIFMKGEWNHESKS